MKFMGFPDDDIKLITLDLIKKNSHTQNANYFDVVLCR